ncbi:chloride channel protein [Corynebacterium sp. TAE3-ERU12]|uniref:chloride channel protein n=1 Tax=Corynebacterium sp. TAE3-ERU12 TaxID=2849491 RepID=UPI001C451681|nr:chloride channel protein [Corynebacterium sp. TAE3-ERU12]MBV7294827.1 chloride channel protein [Corynebacterium sp. TAE3-ERU12]
MTETKQDRAAQRQRHSGLDLSALVRLCIITFIVGVLTGLAAAGLVWVLHIIEGFVYGQHEGELKVVTEGTEPLQRFIGITIAGLIAAPAWYAVRRFGRPIESVEDGMKGTRMPVVETTANAFLQMATVAAGASVGRENAPRELGAMFASGISHKLALNSETTKVLVAAAAGAGLGAIYHIPLAGAVFALEILLTTITVRAVMVVLACSAIATVTSGIIVGTQPLYSTISLTEGFGNLSGAIFVGVLLGASGVLFRRVTAQAQDAAPRGAGVLWQLPLAFMFVGLIGMWVPEVLGNGRNAATQVLEDNPAWTIIGILMLAKLLAVIFTLRSGAVGGLLTPGFAVGSMAGYLLGVLAQPLFPNVPPTDFALMGAAAFLSTAMAAPLFALIVTVEFTGQPSSAYLALFLAAATAALTAEFINHGKFDQVTLPWNRKTGAEQEQPDTDDAPQPGGSRPISKD